jgi:hypothetical protein
MTMEIVPEGVDKKAEPVTKEMSEMRRGETCFVIENNEYVVCVEHCNYRRIYLGLKDYDTVQTYGSEEHLDLQVRELYPGESITIKFS